MNILSDLTLKISRDYTSAEKIIIAEKPHWILLYFF